MSNNLNTFTNVIYVLIWAASFGLINNIIEIYTQNKKKQVFIYGLILIFCVLIYKNIAKKDLVLHNDDPNVKY
jgi:hypothetical protein